MKIIPSVLFKCAWTRCAGWNGGGGEIRTERNNGCEESTGKLPRAVVTTLCVLDDGKEIRGLCIAYDFMTLNNHVDYTELNGFFSRT
jgi:hypothetical protein